MKRQRDVFNRQYLVRCCQFDVCWQRNVPKCTTHRARCMSVFRHVTIVSNLSSVIHRLDVPFGCKMCKISVHCCQSNPMVKEFFVQLLRCRMVVTVNDCVMYGSLLPRHSTARLVRRGRFTHVNASEESSSVKTICVHDLGPNSNEITNELLFVVVLRINFCDGS